MSLSIFDGRNSATHCDGFWGDCETCSKQKWVTSCFFAEIEIPGDIEIAEVGGVTLHLDQIVDCL
jgi:hypothetical protein